MDQMKDRSSLVNYLMIGLLVVGAYFIGVYKTKADLLSAGQTPQVAQVGGTQPTQPEAKTQLSDDEWNKVLENPAFVLGEDDAPVTIVEFTDYQCPFCKRYFDDTYSELISTYVESGKAKYVMRDLPLSFHPNAEPAAVAARCAGKSGKYVAMHDLLFDTQDEWANLSDASDKFIEYGNSLGVNISSCLDDEDVIAAVKDDAALASQVGATGTPTFMINGQILVGAQPTASFTALIDSLL